MALRSDNIDGRIEFGQRVAMSGPEKTHVQGRGQPLKGGRIPLVPLASFFGWIGMLARCWSMQLLR
jgi:hypothetical protein